MSRIFINESDADREPLENLEAANAIYDHLLDGTHYQRQVDAFRAMGWDKTAERVKIDLAAQGIVVS